MYIELSVGGYNATFHIRYDSAFIPGYNLLYRLWSHIINMYGVFTAISLYMYVKRGGDIRSTHVDMTLTAAALSLLSQSTI